MCDEFIATNKRIDELIQRVIELEQRLNAHEVIGEFCPHTLK